MEVSGLGNLVAADDFARGTNSHVVTIRRLCREGRLPAMKIGQRWLVATDLLAEQLRASLLDTDSSGGLDDYALAAVPDLDCGDVMQEDLNP